MELGQVVWAKYAECRPWPAKVIKKRKPSAKHSHLVPVIFFGPEDEFAWVEEDNVLPLTPETIVDFTGGKVRPKGTSRCAPVPLPHSRAPRRMMRATWRQSDWPSSARRGPVRPRSAPPALLRTRRW